MLPRDPKGPEYKLLHPLQYNILSIRFLYSAPELLALVCMSVESKSFWGKLQAAHMNHDVGDAQGATWLQLGLMMEAPRSQKLHKYYTFGTFLLSCSSSFQMVP